MATIRNAAQSVLTLANAKRIIFRLANLVLAQNDFSGSANKKRTFAIVVYIAQAAVAIAIGHPDLPWYAPDSVARIVTH